MAYQCKGCEERFIRKSMLDRHTCGPSDPKKDAVKCELCNMIFINSEVLSKHTCRNKNRTVETNNTTPLVKCQYCGAQFTNANTLKVHERIHTGDMPYKCTECGEKFPYHSNLRSHMRIHNDPIDRPHKCEQCGAKFSQLSNLHAHERTHSTDRTTTCNKCKGLIPENCSHVCPKEGSDPFFVCVECNARFTVKNTLEVHMRTHTGERPYKCTQCNERFIQPGALQSHLRTHSTRLDHECGECGQKFATEERLCEHVRTHAQFTLHKCSVCNAAFANESRLLVHMEQKHVAGDKRNTCGRCNESFTNDADLQSHMKNAHSEPETPKHQCPKCSSAFMTFMLLQNHLRDVHPQPNAPYQNADFRCEDCGCKYTTQNRLIAHRRVKHPEKCLTRRPENSSANTPAPGDSSNEKQNSPSVTKDDPSLVKNDQTPTEKLPAATANKSKPQNLAGDKAETLKRKNESSEDKRAKKPARETGKSKAKSLTCKECDESFETQYQLHIHEQGHKYEKGCDKCGGVRCTCDSEPSTPTKRGRKPQSYSCKTCKQKFVGRQAFGEHECNSSNKKDSESSTTRQGRRQPSRGVRRSTPSPSAASTASMHKCPECQIKFMRKDLLDLHLFQAHKKSFRQCSVCEERCAQPVGQPKGTVFKCEKCADEKLKDDVNIDDNELEVGVGEMGTSNQVQNSTEVKKVEENVMPQIVCVKSEVVMPLAEDPQIDDDAMESIINDMVENDEGSNMMYDLLPGAKKEEKLFADDIKLPVVELAKTVASSSQLVDGIGPAKRIKIEPPSEEDISLVSSSKLSQLVPKFIQIIALDVEGGVLEDFGWPSASSVELMERVVTHYGGTPANNLGSPEETLAANCKELFILCVGSEATEQMLEGRTVEKVIEEVIAHEETGNGIQ